LNVDFFSDTQRATAEDMTKNANPASSDEYDVYDVNSFHVGRMSGLDSSWTYNFRYKPHWQRYLAIPFFVATVALLVTGAVMRAVPFFIGAGACLAVALFFVFLAPVFKRMQLASYIRYCRRMNGPEATDRDIRMCVDKKHDIAAAARGNAGYIIL
jgi:hypothetical protein